MPVGDRLTEVFAFDFGEALHHVAQRLNYSGPMVRDQIIGAGLQIFQKVLQRYHEALVLLDLGIDGAQLLFTPPSMGNP